MFLICLYVGLLLNVAFQKYFYVVFLLGLPQRMINKLCVQIDGYNKYWNVDTHTYDLTQSTFATKRLNKIVSQNEPALENLQPVDYAKGNDRYSLNGIILVSKMLLAVFKNVLVVYFDIKFK